MRGEAGAGEKGLERARRRRRLVRAAFVGYAILLFTATHWPSPTLPAHGVNHLDKVIHFVAFAIWGGLLIAAGYFGSPVSMRNLAAVAIVGVLYAGVDEGLQAIPMLRRTPDWADYGANILGILGAVGTGVWVRKLRRPKD